MESRFLISAVQRSRFYDIRTCARTIEQKGATLGTRKVVTLRADGRHDWLFVGGNLIKVRDAFLLCLRRSRSQWANGPLLFSASQGHGAPQATTYVRLAISTHTPTHRPTRQELLTTDPYIFVRWLILIIIPAHDTKHFGIYFGLGTIILQLVSEQWNRCIVPNSTSDGCIWKIVWQPLRKNILVRSNPPIHRQNCPSSSPRQQHADKRCLYRQHNIVLVFIQILAGKRTDAAQWGRNPVRIPKLIVDRWTDNKRVS